MSGSRKTWGRDYPSEIRVNLAELRGKVVSLKMPKARQERVAKFLQRETVKKERFPYFIAAAAGADVAETEAAEYAAKALTNRETAKKDLLVTAGLAPEGTREVSRPWAGNVNRQKETITVGYLGGSAPLWRRNFNVRETDAKNDRNVDVNQTKGNSKGDKRKGKGKGKKGGSWLSLRRYHCNNYGHFARECAAEKGKGKVKVLRLGYVARTLGARSPLRGE